jgi:hypothetical protein
MIQPFRARSDGRSDSPRNRIVRTSFSCAYDLNDASVLVDHGHSKVRARWKSGNNRVPSRAHEGESVRRPGADRFRTSPDRQMSVPETAICRWLSPNRSSWMARPLPPSSKPRLARTRPGDFRRHVPSMSLVDGAPSRAEGLSYPSPSIRQKSKHIMSIRVRSVSAAVTPDNLGSTEWRHCAVHVAHPSGTSLAVFHVDCSFSTPDNPR